MQYAKIVKYNGHSVFLIRHMGCSDRSIHGMVDISQDFTRNALKQFHCIQGLQFDREICIIHHIKILLIKAGK